MTQPVYCNGCGQRLVVPAGYGKSKMRCAECGVFTDLPAEVREEGQSGDAPRPRAPQKAEAKPAARAAAAPEPPPDEAYAFRDEPPPRPPAPPPEEAPIVAEEDVPEREVLIQGTEEDDFNPYTVTGDAPTKRCPECEKKVEIRAAVCVHCGYNFETKEKARRTFQPVHKEWENGWPFDRRLLAFIVLLAINFATLVASVLADYSFGLTFSMILMTVGLQAFLCGTFDKLTLDRTAKGKVTLTSTWRYAFIPRAPKPIRWKDHESVLIVRTNELDPMDIVMALVLLTYCVVPGILFYLLVIHPDKFTVTLCKDHGFPETPIFRTLSEERANEIMRTVSDVTTLPIHK